MSLACELSLIEKIVPQAVCPDYPRISKPWHQDAILCVSDGRILIAFDAETPPEGMDVAVRAQCKKGQHPPDANAILAQIKDKIQDSLPPVQGPNGDWSARWEAKVECDTCDGSGEVTCDMGHDHDCDDCDGGECIDEVPEARELVQIGDREFARKYIWILSQLPGLELYGASADHMLGFTFTGGRGCLAGFSEDE